mgnify:CR=1 FL=1
MRWVQRLVATAVLVTLTGGVHAQLQTETVDYNIRGQTFTGYIAWDDSVEGKRPGVLVVHEWWGHNAFVRKQAERLAKEGYTAMAVDMYGADRKAEHPDDAKAFMKEATSNFKKTRRRFNNAREILMRHDTVDPQRIAAQGYCFGGSVVLNMARDGADLDGVVSFHGSLGDALMAEPDNVKARVRVFTGGADNFVPAKQVAAFTREMQNAGVDLTLTTFPGVKHSFTNPDADQYAKKFDMPVAYDKEAAERSWRETLEFYHAIFSR